MSNNKLLKYKGLPEKTKRILVEAAPFLRGYNYNLSVSHSHKFVWFRVAKVGTRTLLHELSNAGVKMDSRNQRFISYGDGDYQDYYRFAFVRNPWDRLVSCWRNKIVQQNRFNLSEELHRDLKDFPDFVRYLSTIDLQKTDIHVRPQSYMIDMDRIDFLGRFENYEEDALEVFSHLGIRCDAIATKNQSNAEGVLYRSFYTDDTRELVAEMYNSDIDNFGYKF